MKKNTFITAVLATSFTMYFSSGAYAQGDNFSARTGLKGQAAGLCIMGDSNSTDGVSLPLLPVSHEKYDYAFLSLIPSHAGGLRISVQNFRLDKTGALQLSTESNDRIIETFHSATIAADPIFDQLNTVINDSAVEPPAPADLGEVRDFFPEKVVIIYGGSDTTIKNISFERVAAPDSVVELVARFISAGDQATLNQQPPGVYVRAQQIPNFDSTIQMVDSHFTSTEAASDTLLNALMYSEMALVRAGVKDQPIVFSNGATLLPQQAIHVQVEGTVYRLIAFCF